MPTAIFLFLVWSGAGSQLVPVSVRVMNTAAVPAGALKQAENLAARVFRAAGVDVHWIHCSAAPASCRDSVSGTLWLHLLARKPPRLAPDTAGYTVWVPPPDNDSSYAAVSYPAVLKTAGDLQVDASQLLGAAIAHELGHLLLGPDSHVSGGIMQPRFRAPEIESAGRGALLFTPDQVRAIQAGVSQRIARSAGIPVAR